MKDKYFLQNMAEMCKPLVYIYGQENKKMSLYIQTPKNGQFTKLIPEFQKENTWVICSLDDIVCIVGERINESYKLVAETEKVYLVQPLKNQS